MLQLILGRAFTGKTTVLLKKIEAVVQGEKDIVLLVPEQFTFESERMILEHFGDSVAAKIHVISFTRLCDVVARQCGGLARPILSDTGKMILMDRALKICAPTMLRWKKGARNVGFSTAMLDSVEEFKLNAILPQDLIGAAEKAKGDLREKLLDVAAVYSCYNGLTQQAFLDPSDRLTYLFDQLNRCHFFAGKTVFMDAFKSFTGQQYKVLSAIIAQSEDLYCTLTMDPQSKAQHNIFDNIRKTKESICNLAKAHGISVAADIVLTTPHFVEAPLTGVEQVLSQNEVTPCSAEESVYIAAAQSVSQEAEFCAHTIRRLVREQHYRYRDFLVVARNADVYQQPLLSACRRNGVGIYCADRFRLADFPPVRAVLCAFDFAEVIRTEALFRFYKCGLHCFSLEELSLLENYVSVWGIDGKAWLTDWDMNPDGLQLETDPMTADRLEKLNALRRRAVLPIIAFQKAFKGTAVERGTAIVRLLTDCDAAAAFREMATEIGKAGRLNMADALRQSWTRLMAVLDDLANCFDNEIPDNAAFCTAFQNAVAKESIGVAPQTVDEVVFGAADRIRSRHPKIVYILGCNRGVFPAPIDANGLFGNYDRSQLKAIGLEIPDKTIDAAVDEEFLVYANLCCAAEKVFISYNQSVTDGSAAEPSAFVKRIEKAVAVTRLDASAVMQMRLCPETANAALYAACGLYNSRPVLAREMLQSLPKDYRLRIEKLLQTAECRPHTLSSAAAARLYGNRVMASASSLDLYFKCPFQYFCSVALKAKPMQKAELDALQRGTLVHYAVQRLTEEFGENLGDQTDKTVTDAVERYFDEYLAQIAGYFKIQTILMQYVAAQLKQSTKAVALHLRNEARQSKFVPCETEFSFEKDHAIQIPFPNGNLLLRGKVDRIDQWKNYLRVIDYKTGKEIFYLTNVLHGLNLQMILYLYALMHGEKYKDCTAAGILYFPALKRQESKDLCGNGLIADDEEIRQAMEPEAAGEFVPAYALTKDGSLTGKGKNTYLNTEDFDLLFRYVEMLLQNAGEQIYNGNISPTALHYKYDNKTVSSCKYCSYFAVCAAREQNVTETSKQDNPDVLEYMRRKVKEHGMDG